MSDDGDSDFLSDAETTDDDLEVMVNEVRVKNQNYLEGTVTGYSDQDFFEHFRLSREVVNDISQRFQASTYFHDQPGQYAFTSAPHQILIYLWYIGHQTASFHDVADRFDVTKSSVNRIIYRVTSFLSNLCPDIIQWPNEDEKLIIERQFRLNGFPNIIGAIDGSHIKIDKPDNDPESYFNRKKYYSIQIQAVCDHRRKIRDVFIGYPGSVHDARIFRNSPLNNNLEEKCGRYYLLGDSGYPLQCNLLTPYKDRGNLTQRQMNYNVKLSRTRYIIEHCFGVLKQKFRQLFHIKLRNIRLIVHFIRAACVLHNIAIDDNFPFPLDDPAAAQANIPLPVLPNEEDEDEEEPEDVAAAIVRDRVANSLQM